MMKLHPLRIFTLPFIVAAWIGAALAPLTLADLTERKFGAWTVRCELSADNKARDCILMQNLVLKSGRQTVLQFAIGYAPTDGNPTLLLSLPLGISLPPGVTLKIDKGEPFNFPVERCEPDACRAGLKLRQATIDLLSNAKQLTIIFHDHARQPIEVPLSLEGFRDGFEALREESG